MIDHISVKIRGSQLDTNQRSNTCCRTWECHGCRHGNQLLQYFLPCPPTSLSGILLPPLILHPTTLANTANASPAQQKLIPPLTKHGPHFCSVRSPAGCRVASCLSMSAVTPGSDHSPARNLAKRSAHRRRNAGSCANVRNHQQTEANTIEPSLLHVGGVWVGMSGMVG